MEERNWEDTWRKFRNGLLIACGVAVLGCIIALIALKVNPELNDTAFDMEQRFARAKTVDEQLRQLDRIARKTKGDRMWTYLSSEYIDSEYGGGIVKPLAEPLPEALTPDIDSAREADALPESLRKARFIALYQRGSHSDHRYVLGDFQIRLPKARRASKLEEVDAVLLLVYHEESRTDYISTGPGGGAVNRCYDIYACERGGQSWLLYHKTVSPPAYGTGVLRGDEASLEELWDAVKQMFR